MPQISVNDLKNGITLELDNGLFQVVEFQHVKPGKGGAFVRTKIKNVRSGAVIDKTFNAGIKVEQAIVDLALDDGLVLAGAFRDDEQGEDDPIAVDRRDGDADRLRAARDHDVPRFEHLGLAIVAGDLDLAGADHAAGTNLNDSSRQIARLLAVFH